MPEYIKDDLLDSFFDETLPMLQAPQDMTMNCYHCGQPIRYPLMVRDADRDAFENLIRIAEEYLTERGVMEKMLKEIKNRCRTQMQLNALKRKAEKRLTARNNAKLPTGNMADSS